MLNRYRILFFIFIVSIPSPASILKALADYGRYDQLVSFSIYQMNQKDCLSDCQAKATLNAVRGSILIGDNDSSLLFANLGLQKDYHESYRQKLYVLSAYSNLIDGNWLAYKKLEGYLTGNEKLRLFGVAQIDVATLGERIASESPDLEKQFELSQKNTLWISYQDFPRKSPWVAGIINLVVPGGGYAYLGLWQTAALNLFLTGVCVISSAEMFSKKMYASGLAVASVGSVFYLGGAFGAARSANDINQRNLSEVSGKLRMQLLPELNFDF